MIEFVVNLKKSPGRTTFLILLMSAFAGDLAAQGSGKTNLLLYAFIVLAALLLVGAVMQVADNYLRVEANRHSVGSEGLNLWGTIASVFGPQLPVKLRDASVHVLKEGYDIKLEGVPEPVIRDAGYVTRYAVLPPNFTGLSPIPKVMVDAGENVKAGQPLFFDKTAPEIKYVAPVSGEVLEIRRGAKRAITEVVILADKTVQFLEHNAPDPKTASREELVAFLQESGAWLLLRQRPYNVIADPAAIPVNIFVSTFDSAPLAPDANLIVQGQGDAFQHGLDILGKLTSGDVYLGLDGRGDASPSAIFTAATGVKTHWFRGPHPSGNVGVQIHHMAPMKTTDTVWTLGLQEVITLGRLFLTGHYDARRIVALTGGPIKNPGYLRTYQGAHLGELLKDNISGDNLRYISGDVLSGEQKTSDSYLNFYDDQVTLIKEGNQYEMFGWLMPMTERASVSKTFPNFLFPDVKLNVDTNTHGEKRAFVMTGQYEQMLPMDLYPQHLMKAILTNDVERMEGLGIHEVVDEDVALCEFSCTSKMPLQQILRDGQEMMREQG